MVDKVLAQLRGVAGVPGVREAADAATETITRLVDALEPGAMPCECIAKDVRIDPRTGQPIWATLCRCSRPLAQRDAQGWCDRANRFEAATGRAVD